MEEETINQETQNNKEEEVILDEEKPMFMIGWVKGEEQQLGFKKVGKAKSNMFEIAAMLTHIQARNTLNVFELVQRMDKAVAEQISVQKKKSKEGRAGWRKRPNKTKKQTGQK